MTPQDAPKFIAQLTAMAEVYDAKCSDAKQTIYFEALSDIDLPGVLQAMAQAVRTCRFMPRPSELRDLALGSQQEAAGAAWSDLLGEIRRVGYCGTPNLPTAVLEAVGAIWGSWARLCETLPAPGPELMGWEKRFEQTYAVTLRRQQWLEAGQSLLEQRAKLGPGHEG